MVKLSGTMETLCDGKAIGYNGNKPDRYITLCDGKAIGYNGNKPDRYITLCDGKAIGYNGNNRLHNVM